MHPDEIRIGARAIEKLGRRDITARQVREVVANGGLVMRNPHARQRESRLLVGPDDGGRLLTIVVTRRDDGEWDVRTGWRATRAQIVLYRQRGR